MAISLNGRSTASLFSRLPTRFFAPLASVSRERYWTVLVELLDRRFGPDAPMPPVQGYPVRVIQDDIAAMLEGMDYWDEDAESEDARPINDRARSVLNRLVDCGWLRHEQIGLVFTISMPRDALEFFTLLLDFASNRTLFAGGKVKTIRLALDNVMAEPKGDLLHEAASMTRSLLEYIRNICADVRDLSRDLQSQDSTAAYAQLFFTDLVVGKFIGDYGVLRTHDHPLAERAAIVRIAEELASRRDLYDRLLPWYVEHEGKGEVARGERALQRDLTRLMDMAHVDDYLDRLDTELNAAIRRANTYLAYAVRVHQHNEAVIDAALTRLLAGGDAPAPFGEGSLMGPGRLAEPRRQTAPRAPNKIRTTTMRPEERARLNLNRAAQARRSMTDLAFATLVRQKLGDAVSIDDTAFNGPDIRETLALQRLQRLASLAHSDSLAFRLQARSQARGFALICIDNRESEHALQSGARFRIEQPKRGKSNV
ncbi:Wadjet anti-phage system protein JetA family protein [Jeongeupia naejangsanensis]|uniref:TIGR02677 family protein n=1 Tax=Jeongeupia naejangsanensis TaxID=613195 RepID=A0ABS2BMX7_9NEIS|nr:Wadjet anti-phage system protein JetA family protein [Jeongeupia naejangsanensis]MBM3116408.1 hypothetical protein [Jeongeupia naejangsanensis]